MNEGSWYGFEVIWGLVAKKDEWDFGQIKIMGFISPLPFFLLPRNDVSPIPPFHV